MTMDAPSQVFSFTDHSTAQPTVPQPGDRLDAQFADHANAITSTQAAVNDVRRADGKLKNAIVTLDSMAPSTVEALVAGVRDRVRTDADRAEVAATEAETHADTADVHRMAAQAAAADIAQALNEINAGKGSALAAIAAAEADAIAQSANIADLKTAAMNAANDAEYDKNLAQDWADVSVAWAEHMPDVIPPNILAIMGISGEHWSARWWAHQSDLHAKRAELAAQVAAATGGYYLGAFHTAPTQNPFDGSPIETGAIYYDLTLGALRVWNGTAWKTVTVDYQVAATPVQSNILIDTSGWVFNGSATTFNIRDMGGLPVRPVYASACMVSLDGVVQDPRMYSIAGSDIVFAAAPPAGTTAWMIAGINLSIAATGDMEKSVYDPDGDGKVTRAVTADIATTVLWTGVSDKPSTYPPSLHAHDISDINNLSAALAAKQPLDSDLTAIAALSTEGRLSRNAGGTWFMDTTPYAASAHVHTIADVTGLQTELNNKQPFDADLTVIAALTGDGYLVRLGGGWALSADNFAPLNHTHAISGVTGLQAALDGKAPLASPGFTGTPTAPTANPGTSSTQIATTAFVAAAFAAVPGGGDMLKSVYDKNNDGVVDAAESVPWGGITGKPSTFPPDTHTHTLGQITDLSNLVIDCGEI